MSDKERLETIKFRLTFGSMNLCNAPRLNNFKRPFKTVHKEDLAWLIEQAERTARLVEILRSNKAMTKHRVERIKALEDELGDLNNTLIKRSVKMSKYAKESEKLIEVLEWLKADAENAIGHEWELDPVSVVKNIDEALERFK